MNPTLTDELLSINAIYPSALTLLSSPPPICALRLPTHPSISIRLEFPPSYPSTPPSILGTQTSGDEGTKKGSAATLLATVKSVLAKVYRPGEPCVFDLIEEVAELWHQDGGQSDGTAGTDGEEAVLPPTTGPGEQGKGSVEGSESGGMFHALIRTHHITSRKKVAKLKQAAEACGCYVLLRSGGAPGVMYVEGREAGVREWVGAVQKLRYKDYQLVCRPAALEGRTLKEGEKVGGAGLHEVALVKEFGGKMEEKGVLEWWRRAMGYIS